ncbi:MAG: anhydro-N-acetylmuramic acid kinase [Rhodothermales bacterium]
MYLLSPPVISLEVFSIHPLAHLSSKRPRTVVGLMSGTSLDGVDAVAVRLDGSGRGLQMDVRAFAHTPYPPALRALLLENSEVETSSVRALSQLNVRLAHLYADAVQRVAAEAGLKVEDVDVVGSHGQTVHHVPVATDCAGEAVTSTLQIGDPSVLANCLGVPVVGDFRVADMALGGQGAPLVPYLDFVYFASDDETRGLLNLGGIANLTVLPRGAGPEEVYAFDTGPSNMVIDALTQRFFDEPYDDGGARAGRGHVQRSLLKRLLDDPYYAQPPPKSTGRERYGAAFIDQLLAWADVQATPEDLIATVAMLTIESVYESYRRLVEAQHPLDVLIAAGGGTHNQWIMQHLTERFAPIPVRSIQDYGLNPDAKEALCFAVLAHEFLNGVPTNLPSVTGARRATLLGKLCLPL